MLLSVASNICNCSPAVIKSKGKLIAIATQVLYRNLVEGAVDAALEQAESVLNRIRVRVTHAVGPAVVDGLVLGIEVPLEIDRIGSGLIRVDRVPLGANVLFERGADYLHSGIFHGNQA